MYSRGPRVDLLLRSRLQQRWWGSIRNRIQLQSHYDLVLYTRQHPKRCLWTNAKSKRMGNTQCPLLLERPKALRSLLRTPDNLQHRLLRKFRWKSCSVVRRPCILLCTDVQRPCGRLAGSLFWGVRRSELFEGVPRSQPRTWLKEAVCFENTRRCCLA